MSEDKVFERALRARRDVTKTFFAEFGFDAERSARMVESEVSLIARLRNYMETRDEPVCSFVDRAEPFMTKARELLDDGQVSAVDGTTALPKIDFMNTTQYACAVGWLSSRARGDPHIAITETSSAYVDPVEIRDMSNEDIDAICTRLDQARAQQSWPTTFREHEERRTAVRECGGQVVIIDGPIFTQNLVSQKKGRELLTELITSPKMFIGVIKNLSSSWAEIRWSAAALHRGEVYVVCPAMQPLLTDLDRYDPETRAWLPNADDFVRVVFRPGEKAFAFECRKDDVGMACALLQADASPTLQHELPLLLETIDAQLRAGFDCGLARDAVLNRLMMQKDGYRAAIDAIDERDFR